MATHVNVEDANSCCCSPSTCTMSCDEPSDNDRVLDPTVTEMIAAKLNSLSAEEREFILEDIHGVANTSVKQPKYIEDKLGVLKEEIAKISGKARAAYDLAMTNDPEYVNRDFLLKFLSADEFRPQEAACRIMNHFKYKLDLFGKDKLVKDIKFDDLTAEAQASVYCGSHQDLEVKDVSGRVVTFMFPELIEAVSWENFARARWYGIMTTSDEKSIQHHGFVLAMIGNYRGVDFRLMTIKFQSILQTAMPVRPIAIHRCLINEQSVPAHARFLIEVLEKRFHSRLRIHLEAICTSDNVTTLLYSLQSFGIDPSIVPLGDDGQPQTKLFHELLEKRIAMESKGSIECTNRHREKNMDTTNLSASTEVDPKSKDVMDMTNLSASTDVDPTNQYVMDADNLSATTDVDPTNQDVMDANNLSATTDVDPTNQDVMLGRGMRYPGNFALSQMIDSELAAYQRTQSQFQKSCIVLATVRRIQDSGGRFLRIDRTTQQWVVANDAIARETVSSRFRNKARKMTASTTAIQPRRQQQIHDFNSTIGDST